MQPSSDFQDFPGSASEFLDFPDLEFYFENPGLSKISRTCTNPFAPNYRQSRTFTCDLVKRVKLSQKYLPLENDGKKKIETSACQEEGQAQLLQFLCPYSSDPCPEMRIYIEINISWLGRPLALVKNPRAEAFSNDRVKGTKLYARKCYSIFTKLIIHNAVKITKMGKHGILLY